MLAAVSFPISYRYRQPPPDHREFHFLNLHRAPPGPLGFFTPPQSAWWLAVSPSHGLQDFPFVDVFSFLWSVGSRLVKLFICKQAFILRKALPLCMVSKPSSEVSSAMVMVSNFIILKPFSTNSLNNHKRRFSNFSNSDQNIKSR